MQLKLKICLTIFLVVMVNSFAQSNVIPLWEDAIPNSQETTEKEVIDQGDIIRISKVKIPTLEVYLPAKKSATGKAVVICPGGGYRILAYDWEGTDVAKWFNSKGIAAFVLKYRLPDSKGVKVSYEAPLQDAQRAIRLVRSRAKIYNISPNKIGIVGFSAGGHLASTLGTQYDTPNKFKESAVDTISARPDFMALIYPVVTMKSDYTHLGSRQSLLGENPSDLLIKQYSNELQVTKDTPPTFIVHSGDDVAVPVENSLNLYKALKQKGIEAELHVYPEGGHGYALAIGKGYLQSWTERLYDWLQNQ